MSTSKTSPTAGEIAQGDEVIGSTEGQEITFEAPAETNFPETVEEEAPPLEVMDQAAVLSDAEEGSIWATYVGQGASVVERVLSVSDLKGLGDKEPAGPLVWDRNNRHMVEITEQHPLVIRYLEEIDGNFKVERF